MFPKLISFTHLKLKKQSLLYAIYFKFKKFIENKNTQVLHIQVKEDVYAVFNINMKPPVIKICCGQTIFPLP